MLSYTSIAERVLVRKQREEYKANVHKAEQSFKSTFGFSPPAPSASSNNTLSYNIDGYVVLYDPYSPELKSAWYTVSGKPLRSIETLVDYLHGEIE